MARHILAIETSTSACSIAICRDGELLAQQSYFSDRSHSFLLPGIIKDLIKWSELSLEDMDAIAISSGPGSYTGLRIGLSTAKGLCFTLNKPLIQISSLDALIDGVIDFALPETLVCPMIDARRMEVYAKLVKADRSVVWETQPLILEENTFSTLRENPIIIFGNGAEKGLTILDHPNISFIKDQAPQAGNVVRLAYDKFLKSEFEDLASYEPNYLKEFQTKKPANKLL